MFADAELRFPLIEAALTPVGVIGGIRGVFFANIGGGWFDNQPRVDPLRAARPATSSRRTTTKSASRSSGFRPTRRAATSSTRPATRSRFSVPPRSSPASGCKDGRASYGVGLETFALGFPIHFDWSWRTLFNKDWEDVVFAANGWTARTFRKPRFAVWIGYDF